MGRPRDAYTSDVLVTMRRSSVTSRTTSTTRSMMRRPPNSINALGCPPIRVPLPRAWITPVTLMTMRSYRYGPLTQDTRRPYRAVGDGRSRASRGRPAVEDDVHRSVEVALHLESGRGRLGAARIRARRRDGKPRRPH